MQTEPAVTETKQSKPNLLNILLIAGLVIALLAVIVFGYQDYFVSQQIKATQTDHATLQGKYDALIKEKNTLTSDLDTTNTDLDQARTDLETLRQTLATEQDNLAKAQEEQTTLQGKIDQALKYLDVAVGYWVDDVSTSNLGKMVDAVGDADFTKKFERWRDDKSNSDRWVSWITYMFVSATDLLNIE